MENRFLVQILRDGRVIKEFTPSYAWSGPIDNRDAAITYARWFIRHYGLNRDSFRVL